MTSSALFRQTGRRITDITFRKQSSASASSCEKEKLQLDIAALRKQYAKLRERQKQAHVMFWTAAATNAASSCEVSPGPTTTSPAASTANANPLANILAGKKPLLARRSSSSAASCSSAGPRLRLPPARVVQPLHAPITTTQNVMVNRMFDALHRVVIALVDDLTPSPTSENRLQRAMIIRN